MKKFKLSTYIISREVCIFSLFTYLVLFLIETLKKDVVSFFFNLHILLPFIFISGFIAVVMYRKEQVIEFSKKTAIIKKLFVSCLLVIGGGFIVFIMTQALGAISLILASIAAIIFLIVSIYSL